MPQTELIIFATPDSPACHRLEAHLKEKGIRFRTLDVSADRRALVALLRIAGQPVVPTVYAYGEVMVGFDEVRLEHLLDGLDARAEAAVRTNFEEEEQLRQTAALIDGEVKRGELVIDPEVQRLLDDLEAHKPKA